MKKILLTAIFSLLLPFFLLAQTWNGSSSTDWNNPANWSTNNVPTNTSNITIPNSVTNWPILTSNISVNRLIMDEGTELDVNGFEITIGDYARFNGSDTLPNTINNSSTSNPEIVINITGSGPTYINGTIFNKSLVLNHLGTGTIYESRNNANLYHQNFEFHVNSSGTIYTSYDEGSTINGDFIFNRTVPGNSYLFYRGNNVIIGNFSYENEQGGNTTIGANSSAITINGTLKIDYTGQTPGDFVINNLKNQTLGGFISIDNSSTTTHLTNNHIKASNLSITNYNSISTGSTHLIKFESNKIEGSIAISDQSSNTRSFNIGGNTINGSFQITKNGTGTITQGNNNGIDSIIGDFTININSTSTLNTSNDNGTFVSGDYVINRTLAGTTEIFKSGESIIEGDFILNVQEGASTIIGNNGNKAYVDGKIDIDYTGVGSEAFQLINIKNTTNGGEITIREPSKDTYILDNSLMVNQISITDYLSTTNASIYYLNFSGNQIDGLVSISDNMDNTREMYIGGNEILGAINIIKNGTGVLYESYVNANEITGDLGIEINNIGNVITSRDATTNVKLSKNLFYICYLIFQKNTPIL